MNRQLLVVLFFLFNLHPPVYAQEPPRIPPNKDPAPAAPPSDAVPVFKSEFTEEQMRQMIENLTAPYDYQPEGRRDPFMAPEILRPPSDLPSHGPFLALQGYKLSDLKVRAILWSVKRPKALIQAPDGKVHMIGLGDRLGDQNGYVSVIREGEIVVIETVERSGRGFASSKIMTLSK